MRPILVVALLALAAAAVPIEPSFEPLITSEPLLIEPSLEPEPSPPPPPTVLVNAPRLSLSPSPAPKRTYAVLLELLHALPEVEGSLDSAFRKASAHVSRSTFDDWTLVDAKPIDSPAAADADIAAVVSRQVAGGTEQQQQEALRPWRVLYNARVNEDVVAPYSRFVRSGGLNAALRQFPEIGTVRARLLANPTEAAVTPMSTVPLSEPPPRQPQAPPPPPRTTAKEPPNSAAESPLQTEPSTEDASTAAAGAPSSSEAKRSRRPWFIGVGIALVAVAAAVAALALLAMRSRRRSRAAGGDDHEGAALGIPPSLSRSPSNASAPNYRVTSVGPPPRGPEALRHQNNIMHWQLSAAAASGKDLRASDASGVDAIVRNSSATTGLTTSSGAATAVTTATTTARSSSAAMHTSHTSSVYPHSSSHSSNSVLARTASESSQDDAQFDSADGGQDDDDMDEGVYAKRIDTMGSDAFAVGDSPPMSPRASSTPGGAGGGDGATDLLSFVRFGATFGGPS